MGVGGQSSNPLLDIVDIADEYGEQQDFNNAATLYKIIIRSGINPAETLKVRWR